MSAKTIVPRSLAHSDVEKAIGYYLEVANSATALAFVDALEAAYAHIGRNPATGSSHYAHELNFPGVRVWPLTKYPYLIFYAELDQHIDVWRVLHMATDIPSWLGTD